MAQVATVLRRSNGELAMLASGNAYLNTHLGIGSLSAPSSINALTIIETNTEITGEPAGIQVIMQHNPSAAAAGLIAAGIDCTSLTALGNVRAIGTAYGNAGTVIHSSTGTITLAAGVAGSIWMGNPTAGAGGGNGDGAITTAAGVMGFPVVRQIAGSTGAVTNAIGLYGVSGVDAELLTSNIASVQGLTQTYGTVTNIAGAFEYCGIANGITNTIVAIAALFVGDKSVQVGNQNSSSSIVGGLYLGQVTLTSSVASRTFLQAATLYVKGPPINGGNVLFTTGPYAFWVDAGPVRLDTQVALGGGAGATLGTIGGSGPTAAAQNEWLRIDSASGVRFVPAWA